MPGAGYPAVSVANVSGCSALLGPSSYSVLPELDCRTRDTMRFDCCVLSLRRGTGVVRDAKLGRSMRMISTSAASDRRLSPTRGFRRGGSSAAGSRRAAACRARAPNGRLGTFPYSARLMLTGQDTRHNLLPCLPRPSGTNAFNGGELTHKGVDHRMGRAKAGGRRRHHVLENDLW